MDNRTNNNILHMATNQTKLKKLEDKKMENIKIAGLIALVAYAIVIITNLNGYGLGIFLHTWTIEYPLVIYIASLLTLKELKKD